MDAKPPLKLVPLQALRAVAALTVAVIHLTFAFARHMDRRFEGLPDGAQLAQTAVALFFVLSGCVMVISSTKMFGSPKGALRFWRRRATRVLPPYWIATVLMAAVLASLGHSVDAGYALRSMAFIPVVGSGGAGFHLYLWPGWTLLYELIFYTIFGAFVVLGRPNAVLATAAALVGLVAAGAIATAPNLFFAIVTRPIILLFIVGMVFGLALQQRLTAPVWLRWLAAGGAAVLLGSIKLAGAPLGFGYLAWAGLPAIMLFFAVMAGPIALPWPRALETLGDASYAIYLLHVPFAHLWMRVFNSWLGHPGGSLGYVVLGLPLLVALSIVFHRKIERPLTAWLNRLLGERSPSKRDLAVTLAP